MLVPPPCEPGACLPQVRDMFVVLRCNSDTDHMPICAEKYDSILHVGESQPGVVTVVTAAGIALSVIHTVDEVLQAVDLAKQNHLNFAETLRKMAKGE